MKLGIILYGALGDIAALSALSKIVKKQGNNTLVLITEESFKEFAKIYGEFDKVIGFTKRDIGKTIKEVNDSDIETICDLHTSSYSNPEFIYWMREIKAKKIRTPTIRAKMIYSNAVSPIEELENRIIEVGTHNVRHYIERLDIDIKISEDSLRIDPTSEDQKYAISKKIEFHGKKVIGFIPNSMREHKKWSNKNWSYVSNQLRNLGFSTAILCAEFELDETIDLANVTKSYTLISQEPQGYIRNILSTDLIVSIDTGPKHIAGYLGHPVVSLYGHASPRIWGTLSSSEINLISDIDCSPCNNPFFCKYGKATCVDSISPDLVIEQIKHITERR